MKIKLRQLRKTNPAKIMIFGFSKFLKIEINDREGKWLVSGTCFRCSLYESILKRM